MSIEYNAKIRIFIIFYYILYDLINEILKFMNMPLKSDSNYKEVEYVRKDPRLKSL